MADAHSATAAQIALPWVIRHPAVVAIPGVSSVEQLEDNVAAADIELTDEEYLALKVASDKFRPVPGPGWISRQVQAVFRARPMARVATGALTYPGPQGPSPSTTTASSKARTASKR